MLSRRAFLSTSALALGQRPRRPNIVVILTDDLGYGDIAAYNPASKIPTPHIDRLAREGTRFLDAHSPDGVCSPTRYALLTGRYAWRSDLKSAVLWPWDRPLIEKERLTLPAMLRTQGYKTACIGKWHLGWDWATKDGRRLNDTLAIGDNDRPKRIAFNANIDFTKPVANGPITRGFDYYFGDDVPNFQPYTFIENDKLQQIPSVEKPEEMFGYPGPAAPGWTLEAVLPEITKRSAQYVAQNSGKPNPYFLYFALTSPHLPLAVSPEFKGKSKAGLYGDWVHQTDHSIGQIMDAIRKSPDAQNTLVFFTSDNGPENPAYKNLQDTGHNSAGPLRGVKRMLWEGGHRVPFIAWWPGRIAANATSKETICHVDIMATCAALTNYKLANASAEDSYDLSPALFAKSPKGPIREATVHHSMDNQYAIRQGDWVFLDSKNGGGNAEPEWFRKQHGVVPHSEPGELFHLAEDLGETRNLYAQYPDRVKALKTLLEKYKREGRSTPTR